MTQPIIHDEKRAVGIAEIRQFADWLERNPDVPLPMSFTAQKQMAYPSFGDDISPTEGLTRVRDFAAKHDGRLDESLNDRTVATVRFGIAGYSLLTWHKEGRPSERDAELEQLRARVAELEAAQTAEQVACSPECQARPEEWPCLDDCPAQVAARP